ncbi:hypothetical protein Vadar_028854 [Vaccinium darrowii]|uniref:Uncharacterized protein n=1 Tax=Vaccinium darrowii TaxID=229202 RepID=A0ACB7Z054_9ERIC|nr:hypothetical protein Vadar_028854 [Vaccinium darrowii]
MVFIAIISLQTNKPALWTEAWTSWFMEFGGPIQQQPVEDLAFAVARFIREAFGRNNFGRTTGGPLHHYHIQTFARVGFNDIYYDLQAWSISILPDCKNVIFNTAKVGVQTSKTEMLPTNTKLLSWETFNEDLSSAYEDTEITTL